MEGTESSNRYLLQIEPLLWPAKKKEKGKEIFVILFVRRKYTLTLLNYLNVQSLLKFKFESILTIMQRST